MAVQPPIEEEIPEQELRNAVMVRHPLTLRGMTERFQFVVVYRLSKSHFKELWDAYRETFQDAPGLICGAWHIDTEGPSRTLAWCGYEGERTMLIADGSAGHDNSVIHLAFSNFADIPDLPCRYWKPVLMKSRDGENPWGIPVDDLERVPTVTPLKTVTPKLGLWTRFWNWLHT